MNRIKIFSGNGLSFVWCWSKCINTLRRDIMAAILQTTVSNAFSWMKMCKISIKIYLKFVPGGPINNIPALVQIMAKLRPGYKPLSEPMVIRLLTHICFTCSERVKCIYLVMFLRCVYYNIYIYILIYTWSLGCGKQGTTWETWAFLIV